MGLSNKDRTLLLRVARQSIEAGLEGRPVPRRADLPAALRERAGAFVTLHLQHALRGCIGYIEPRFPLYEAVEEVAQKAAFDDPRFPPLIREELEQVEIEISVLSPLHKIGSVEEIEIGKHGLVIEAGYARGLLLPQVATEYGWGKEQFLTQTCRKAGLPGDSWKRSHVNIFVFQCDVFSEAETSSHSKGE